MNLAARSTAAECMDTDCTDFADYRRCLRDLSRVNVVTMTYRPTLAWLARETRGMTAFSLLDVGCGHGDMLRHIRKWAGRRGLAATLEGIDLNPWSTKVASEATPPDAAIAYHTGNAFAFADAAKFDFIISAQFTHHLDDAQLAAFLRWMEANARRGWFVSDLHRHWFAYYGFGLLARLAFWHRFVRHDGMVSIARSFRTAEWRASLAAAGVPSDAAEISWHAPFRLCVARRCARH